MPSSPDRFINTQLYITPIRNSTRLETRDVPMERTRQAEEKRNTYYGHPSLLFGAGMHAELWNALALFETAKKINRRPEDIKTKDTPTLKKYFGYLNDHAMAEGLEIQRPNDLWEPYYVGTELHERFRDAAWGVAQELYDNKLNLQKGWTVAWLPELDLWPPVHQIQRVYKILSDPEEKFYQYLEDKGYGNLGQVVTQAVSEPDFRLKAPVDPEFGESGGAGLSMEQIRVLLQNKDVVVGARDQEFVKLMQVLFFLSNHYLLDREKLARTDNRGLQQNAGNIILSGSSRMDMLGLGYDQGDLEAKRVVDNLIDTVKRDEDKMLPFNMLKTDGRVIQNRRLLAEYMIEGRVVRRSIEGKTIFRDAHYAGKYQYVDNDFDHLEDIPKSHMRSAGVALFTGHQITQRWLTHSSRDKDWYPLVEHMSTRKGDPEYPKTSRQMRTYIRGMMGRNHIDYAVRMGAPYIQASTEDSQAPQAYPWYGADYQAIAREPVRYAVVPLPRIPLMHSIFDAGERLVLNAQKNNIKPQPLEPTVEEET